ncbi:hypothetical protein LEP1GSC050_2465 [Leptospira broomii serovar Hurstbridge str. 5399]|uniref:Uncharacterized protein n=1 Tax=Leptospira broomii serovar Hurstbridge str. 5399 TaxID=1049789 RepID=T0EYF7_9LEPT|nr:hypothetical protein LEP1GSC050_2465 [Leptospira broomii serovar Hurstbridge str. 5399]
MNSVAARRFSIIYWSNLRKILCHFSGAQFILRKQARDSISE